MNRVARRTMQYATAGFAIPAIFIGLLAFVHFNFREIHPIDQQNDLTRLPAMILIPSFGLATLFALAAIGSNAASRGLSFTRSLMFIAAATLIAVFATRPRVQRKTVEPDAWMETAIPISVALVATIIAVLYNKRRGSQAETNKTAGANENGIAR